MNSNMLCMDICTYGSVLMTGFFPIDMYYNPFLEPEVYVFTYTYTCMYTYEYMLCCCVLLCLSVVLCCLAFLSKHLMDD